MPICDESQLSATNFYNALMKLVDGPNLNTISTIYGQCQSILSYVSDLSQIVTQAARQFFIKSFRALFLSICYLPAHCVGVLLSFIYNHLYFGSQKLSAFRIGTGTAYSIVIQFYTQIVGYSGPNTHFSLTFNTQDFTELPSQIYSVSCDQGTPAEVFEDYNSDFVITVTFNLCDIDLKKIFNFVEGENTENILDRVQSLFSEEDD